MNEFERLHRQAKEIKENYPSGTRIHLINMDDPFAPIPSGTRGTVEVVDSIGQIHMSWDNGRTLALVPGVDFFRKLTAKELEEEASPPSLINKPSLLSQIESAAAKVSDSSPNFSRNLPERH